MTRQYKGHNPKINSDERNLAQMTMQRNHHFPDEHVEFSHLLTTHINKLMIIAKRENHTQRTYNKQKG